ISRPPSSSNGMRGILCSAMSRLHYTSAWCRFSSNSPTREYPQAPQEKLRTPKLTPRRWAAETVRQNWGNLLPLITRAEREPTPAITPSTAPNAGQSPTPTHEPDHADDPELQGAFREAAADGSLDMVELLVDLGANVNAADAKEGSALEAAASGGHANVVEYL